MKWESAFFLPWEFLLGSLPSRMSDRQVLVGRNVPSYSGFFIPVRPVKVEIKMIWLVTIQCNWTLTWYQALRVFRGTISNPAWGLPTSQTWALGRWLQGVALPSQMNPLLNLGGATCICAVKLEGVWGLWGSASAPFPGHCWPGPHNCLCGHEGTAPWQVISLFSLYGLIYT